MLLQEGEEGATGSKHSPGVAAKRELGQAGVCEQGHWAAAPGSGHCSSGSPEGPPGTSSLGIRSQAPAQARQQEWSGLDSTGMG